MWRATPSVMQNRIKSETISIHALRVEGDFFNFAIHKLKSRFQSTPSVWRATHKDEVKAILKAISIHALRVEGDGYRTRRGRRRTHFNPRPPCGGRPHRSFRQANNRRISIHALRVEGDSKNAQITHGDFIHISLIHPLLFCFI